MIQRLHLKKIKRLKIKDLIRFMVGEILIWSRDQRNSVRSHTHIKKYFLIIKRKLIKKMIEYFEENLFMCVSKHY